MEEENGCDDQAIASRSKYERKNEKREKEQIEK